ncbi:MAG TPA: succinate dehydrogenase, hydrophobic membrane anchor protein, partial [Tahibacter sp.]|nr:succinate dehydrogenase, hydrophobic membrane anchor protein [Tahibacter sp.]
ACWAVHQIGVDLADVRASIAHPLHATLLLAFVWTLFWHLQLGLQVVLEDYVTTRGLEVVSQIAVKLLAVLGALVCALAVVRIALAG